jgi:hypothetical protein
MLRWSVIAGFVFGLTGCGESHRPRVVPVTPASASSEDGVAPQPVTKPPRAIATH